MKPLVIIFLATAALIVNVSSGMEECTGSNEIFQVCANTACDQYCDNRPCLINYFKCPDRCTCLPGYVRSTKNEKNCIPRSDCT
ncbi:hypothetical protein DMENIID0001_100740 [Sergentomyia squamirostris]